MTRAHTPQRKDGRLGVMVCWSAVIHLAVYLFLLYFHFPARYQEAPVYYVELTNLPVANPQAGTPGGAEQTLAPAPPPPPVPPAPREMTLPAKPSEKAPNRQTTPAPNKETEAKKAAREFEERMERMEREAAARHAADAIAALRKGGATKGPAGMPGATGTEAGSDYASYIRSRLEDAFRTVDTFKPDPGKVVIVRLTIDRSGRIVGQRYEQYSNDQMFNEAVTRAIARAEKEFRPPPGGGQFEHGFVFKPQGVGKK